MAKQPVWTKQCMRMIEISRLVEEFNGVVLTKRRVEIQKELCGHYMPDDHDRCDTCLRHDYPEFFNEARYDCCDHDGRGDPHIDVDIVVNMIRRAERSGPPEPPA